MLIALPTTISNTALAPQGHFESFVNARMYAINRKRPETLHNHYVMIIF
jgi:hypothetical protein